MRESSACLVRSFSLSSPTSSEEKKGNTTLQRALTTSVSFGRFMSESLDWEKWSAFSHNRYLEEVERYSKPGSVAEKKAYFEAHFKRRRAAALLEQQNAAGCSIPETNEEISVQDNYSSSGLDLAQTNSYGKDVDTQNSDPLSSSIRENDSNDASVETNPETAPSGVTEEVPEPPIAMETLQVELTKNLENNECSGDDIMTKKVDKACDEDDSNKRTSASLNEKKPEVSSSCKQLTYGGASNFAPPVKQIMPTQIRNSLKTPNSKKNDMESSNKRRSYTTSLHMSINFSQTAKFPGPQKVVANSRLVRAPPKKYINSTFPQTSTRASVSSVSKHHSVAPPAENRRTVTPQCASKSVRKAVDWKVHSQSSYFSKSSNACDGKARLATTSSPFTFKSEERAAKRKEFFQKLEQKSKLKETEKHGYVKSQVKARSSFKDIRSSIVFKETENAEFPPRMKVPSNLKKKIPNDRQWFPEINERAPFKVQVNDFRPPRIILVKTEGAKDVSGNNLRPHRKCFSKKNNENASPNTQIEHKLGRYK